MARDPRIDEHIAKAGEFARPILSHFRAAVHRVVPECEEAIKWGMPHFTLGGRNLAGMSAFKKHVSIFFHTDGEGGGTGRFRQVTSLDDLPSVDELEARIRDAAGRLANPVRAKKPAAPRVPKAEIAMPDDLAAALSAGARANLDGFAPSHRREYLEWITEAKRPETRAKRIAQAAEWLAEGKKRNWKYEGC